VKEALVGLQQLMNPQKNRPVSFDLTITGVYDGESVESVHLMRENIGRLGGQENPRPKVIKRW
jgi:hypothetical protein